MRIDGIQLNEGSKISNLTVASGTAFPSGPNEAEVFFRSDASLSVRGLYCYIGGSWDRIASSDTLTVPTGATLPVEQIEGDLFYRNTNDSNEGLYVYDGSAWVAVASGSTAYTITGDVSGTIDGGTDVLTLASVISPGSFGGAASSTPSFTVDAKGRVTAASTASIEISASQVTTGTFPDGRIPQSAVTQHQAALTILESQITDGSLLARNASTETISGNWTFSSNLVLNNATYLSGKNSSGFTTRMLGINGSNDIYIGSIDVATGGDWIFINGTERMRITAAGDVGIGSTPANYGAGTVNLSVRATSIPVLDFIIGSTRTGSIIATTGEFRMNSSTALPLTFFTNNVERARITSAGSVVVNSTTNVGIGGGADVFAVNGSIGLGVQVNFAPGVGNNAELVNRSTSGGMRFYTNAGAQIPLELQSGAATGTLVVTATSTVTYNGTEIGFRVVPRVAIAGGTATTAARGMCYSTTAGVTIPASTFAAGDAISIFNSGASSLTITQGGGLTMYGTAGATGNRTLAGRGMCTIWFESATICKITGEIT